MKRFSILSIACLVGCGNVVIDDGSGGSASTGANTSSSSKASSTGSGGPCAAFADQTGPAPVTVRFRNDSGLPIYLPSNCSEPEYTLSLAGSMSPPSNYHYDKSCLQTCEDLQTQPPFACGACAPISYLLAPGATREVVWDGTGLVNAPMPDSCYFQPQPSCSQIIAAPSGQYNLSAVGYDGCGANCTCDANGVCNGIAEGFQATSDFAKLSFPGEGVVEIVFGTCAFPCPGGG